MYVGAVPTTGDFKILDSITTSSATTFNLRQGGVAVYPQSANHCLVVLNGVLQTAGSSFNIVNDTIVFASSLSSSDVINQILVLGNVNDIGVPSDDTVSTAKIQDNAITLAKMASGTDGNIISYDASGNPVAIATGNDGQVLTSTGAGSPPAFEDAAGGSFTKLSTVDLSSGDSLAAFNSSIITTTYKQYLFIFTNLRPTDDNAYFKMGESKNNGSSFLANDADSFISIHNTSFSSTEVENHSVTNNTDVQLTQSYIGNGTMEGMSGQMFYSRDGANPSKGNWQLVSSNSNHVYYQTGAFYRDDTGTSNYVRFQMQGTTFISGRITCYGIDT